MNTRAQVGNWFLFRMSMRGLGALGGALLVYSFGHVELARSTQVTAAVGFGIVGGVAGHLLGHFTRRPDGELPVVDALVRVMAWASLVVGAAAVTSRWPAVGMAAWVMLTQAAVPSVVAALRPWWSRMRMEHLAPPVEQRETARSGRVAEVEV